MATEVAHGGIGASVKRKEDARFLAGRGNYVDDMNRPGQLYAFIKRSDRPHARIRGGSSETRQNCCLTRMRMALIS